MLRIDIPGRGVLELEHLVLDVNGTIAEDGAVLPGVPEALASLATDLRVVALTADTHGTASGLRAALGMDIHVIAAGNEAQQKRAFVQGLREESVVAIGNGANDATMLETAAIGICVVGPEGAAASALSSADIVVRDVLDALALLISPRRLAATLRR